MKIYNHKSKTELIAEIQKLRQALDQSTPNVNNLMRQCDDLTLVNDLNSAVIQRRPLADILSLLSRSVSAIFNSSGVAIYLLSRDNNSVEMQPNTLPPKISDLIERLLSVKIPEVVIKRSSDSYYFKALTSGTPLTINGTNNINKLIYEFTDSKIIRKHVPKIQKVIGIKNVLIFPLVFGNSALGVMDISRNHPFADSEIQRLQQIVSPVTEAILCHQVILEKESLLNELQAAYNKLKKLSGLIPICAHCKKIRDDSGYWNQVEKYITKHTDAVFSHGICPDCLDKYYPEFVKNRQQKDRKI